MSELKEQSPMDLMLRQQIWERGIQDPALIEVMRSVPRERFFPADVRGDAYADRPTEIGHGQTISQPYMVALMTQRLELQPDYRVLEIGTGSGYQTAILSRLCAEVYTVERLKPLLDDAWERCMELNLRNIRFRHGDGTRGWPEAGPFDRILIGAGAPSVPEHLLRTQLKPGGIAILPVGPLEEQLLAKMTLKDDVLIRSDICRCRFVKLIGQEGWSEAT